MKKLKGKSLISKKKEQTKSPVIKKKPVKKEAKRKQVNPTGVRAVGKQFSVPVNKKTISQSRTDIRVIKQQGIPVIPKKKFDTLIKQTVDQLTGRKLMYLADEEGLTIRDTVKHEDLLNKIGLTKVTCSPQIMSEAMNQNQAWVNDIQERVTRFNERNKYA